MIRSHRDDTGGVISVITWAPRFMRSIRGRKLINALVTIIAGLAAVLGLFMLLWILFTIIRNGIAAINWDFFTEIPKSALEKGGGVAHAIVGTVLIASVATLIGVPLGMLAGVYLSEFGQGGRFANASRFVANVLIGAPSIVVGLFVYTVLVIPMKTPSGLAGAVALAIIMLPVVTRTTEDMLRLVPNSLRESALALGAPEYKMIFQVIFRSAKSGLLTGVMLAVARVSGETAPLLFTTLYSSYWSVDMIRPMGNLTITIYNYALSGYPAWEVKAWGASLLITAGVLLMNLTARLITRERKTRI